MMVLDQSTAIKDQECFTLISFSSSCRNFLALGSSSLHVTSSLRMHQTFSTSSPDKAVSFSKWQNYWEVPQ